MSTGPGAAGVPATPAPFDVCGPLPTGTAVLEASAGTGKTFTIAALATRYVAEGIAELPELMLVTFSRAATQELRERVRERLVSAERGLAYPERARSTVDDTVLRLLADAPDDEVRTRQARLHRALSAFDAATITTTHGFCQQMLTGLGMAGDSEPGETLVERIDDLVTEISTDLYVRKFAPGGGAADLLSFDTAQKVARVATQDRQARLVPATDADPVGARDRFGLAEAVRREIRTRKRARRLFDYDDLLSRLRDVLLDDVAGPAAQERLRARYRVVLVDEFQDTDPVQWQILHAAFHQHSTLVLIGDPKQAIYAFRGADVVTYLQARGSATTERTLTRNWRSDAPLLDALGALFAGAALGDERIVVRPVDAQHAGRRLDGAGAPLRLRVLDRGADPAATRPMSSVTVVRPHIARDVAGDIVGLLSGAATLRLRADDAARPVRPGDVAVLVRTNDQATLVHDALRAADVPAVITGTRSVFRSRVARDWLTLLEAVEAPYRAGLVRAAALTPFIGWSATRLATAGDDELDELARRLRDWRDVFGERGIAALLETVTATTGLTERLLATDTGERDLTDLRHIGQALHAEGTAAHLGPAALVGWLRHRINDAADDPTEERSRRLESDADAVQVITVHSSKGLEFPVVYVPYAWDRAAGNVPLALRLHDADGTRLLDVRGDGHGYADNRAVHQREEYGEDLRLLYVAVTRAMCQVVAWWARSKNTPTAPLHRLLFAGASPGEVPPHIVQVPSDIAVRQHLQRWAAAAPDAISVERVETDGDAATSWRPDAAAVPSLSAGVFDRPLDRTWRRTSYTGLTAALHDREHPPPAVGSEPEVEERQDEPDVPAGTSGGATGDAVADEAALRAVPSPMSALPSGAAFGTLVHGVLEAVDTAASDLATEVRERCAEATARRLTTSLDPDILAAALLPALETPLGPLTGDRPLRAITPADRLPEMEFELPLAGGDHAHVAGGDHAHVAGGDDPRVHAITRLLRTHLPADDVLAGYPAALDVPQLAGQRLRGYLTGSIDAVLRVRDASGVPRYVVVDYKTNRLDGPAGVGIAPGDGMLSAWHYRPAALTAAMVRAHYPLQALLYSVALHRFLRWRQRGYDPAQHLGGVLYLFLRGMCGPATPRVNGVPCGVFSWQPPVTVVTELSALLEGRQA